jgi:phosphatidylserine/phosphatidylglycerophosphate/cardiolipin synthase-like enzyme
MRMIPLFFLFFCAFAQAIEPSTVKSNTLNTLPSVLRGPLQEGRVLVSAEAGYFAKLDIIKNAKPGATVKMGYFIFENDYSTSYLVKEMIQQARRGIKFEIIVDAAMAEGFKEWLGFIGNQANIELRLFRGMTNDFRVFLSRELQVANPDLVWQGVARQKPSLLSEALASSPYLMTKVAGAKALIEAAKKPGASSSLLMQGLLVRLGASQNKQDLARAQELKQHLYEVSMRFHHKMIISDTGNGLHFVVGGRNLSDEYHMSVGSPLLAGRNYPFFDADISGVLETNLEKRQMLESFNRLWAVSEPHKTGNLSAADQTKYQENSKAFEQSLSLHQSRVRTGFVSLPNNVEVAYTENKPNRDSKSVAEKQILLSWLALIKNSGQKIVIPSAYVFFEPKITEALRQAAALGKTIEVYTNSFTSTDMNMVNLAMYLTLPELRKTFGKRLVLNELKKGKGEGSLHAKLFWNGLGILGVGSANFDPRTNNLDSNNSFFIDLAHQPQVAQEILSRYLDAQNDSGLGLEWFEVTDAYAKSILDAAKAQNPQLLQALRQSIVQQQL